MEFVSSIYQQMNGLNNSTVCVTRMHDLQPGLILLAGNIISLDIALLIKFLQD